MIKTLQYIAENYGIDVLRDGNKLIAFYSDLAPRQKRERQMLEFFVKCNGNNKLLDALHRSPKEQEACVRVLVEQMSTQLLMSEDAAYAVCENFWTAIGGTPFSRPAAKTAPVPQSASNPVSKPIKFWKFLIPIVVVFVVAMSILFTRTNTSATPEHDNATPHNSSNISTGEDTKGSDGVKRLSQIVYSWDGDESKTYLHYNSEGLLERVSFADYSYTRYDYVYDYDSEGRLRKVESGSKTEDFYEYRYVELFYDAEGRLATWKRFSPGHGSGQGSYVYDDNENVAQVLVSWEAYFTSNIIFTYENGLLTETNALWQTDDYYSVYTTYQYDAQKRVISSTVAYDYGDGPTDGYTETYGYEYPSVVYVQSENYSHGYYDLGHFSDLDPYIGLDLAQEIYSPFSFSMETIDNVVTDEDGYIILLEGTVNQGTNKLRFELIYEE